MPIQRKRIDFGGKLTTGSGNKWYDPGDSRNDVWLIENKQTDKLSFSVSKKLWAEIAHKALFKFKYPMLSIQIQDIDLMVIDKKDFLRLLKGAERKKEIGGT